MNSREILAKAAEVISERGHHKGDFEDPKTGAVCVMQAIFIAAQDECFQACGTAVAILSEHANGGIVPDWNDHPDTTAEDVILTLKKLGAGE